MEDLYGGVVSLGRGSSLGKGRVACQWGAIADFIWHVLFVFIAGYDVGLTDFFIAHCETNEGGSHAKKVR